MTKNDILVNFFLKVNKRKAMKMLLAVAATVAGFGNLVDVHVQIGPIVRTTDANVTDVKVETDLWADGRPTTAIVL